MELQRDSRCKRILRKSSDSPRVGLNLINDAVSRDTTSKNDLKLPEQQLRVMYSVHRIYIYAVYSQLVTHFRLIDRSSTSLPPTGGVFAMCSRFITDTPTFDTRTFDA
jgi:hypothetical protein